MMPSNCPTPPPPPMASGGTRRERTVSSEGSATTKSILKSPSDAVPPPDPVGSLSASYSRLMSSSAGRSRVGRFRQHSMDAALAGGPHQQGCGRAVKFFLESEETPTPEKRSPNISGGGHRAQSSERPPPLALKVDNARPPNSTAFYRRTSLPAQPITSRQNLYLQGQLNSARGLLMDLLASSDRHELPPNVTACLRAVTALLNTAPGGGGTGGGQAQQNGAGGFIAGANQSTLSLSEFGLPSVLETPYSGEIHVSMTSKPRVSNITFSTVTSATGLPTIAAEPSRPRSSSYWKPHLGGTGQSSSSLHNNNNHSSSNRRGGGGTSPVDEQHSLEQPDDDEEPSGERGKAKDDEEHPSGRPQPLLSARRRSSATAKSTTVPAAKVVARGAAAEGGGGAVPSGGAGTAATAQTAASKKLHAGGAGVPRPTVATLATLTVARPEAVPATSTTQMTGQPKSGSKSTTAQMTPQQDQQKQTELAGGKQSQLSGKKVAKSAPVLMDEECCSNSSGSDHSFASTSYGSEQSLVYKTVDGTTFDRAELEQRDPALKQIQEWSFPIFHFADKHKRTVLSRLTYAIFKEADLFRTFKISYAKFFNYFHALESGYWDIPYHNRIHAADVLHGCYYLTCHSVNAFCCYHSELDEEEGDQEERLAELEDNHCGQQSAEGGANSKDPNGQGGNFDMMTAAPLAQSMSALELMALYTAAAMHDYDHPGRTNAFLVASEDRKAILYNDRSVLENHHAAESWRLLSSQSQNHFIENLDSAETKRFRYLVLEYILATDLKQHFDIIMQFNERAPDMDMANESDRVLVSLMLIKFADINSPAKPYSLHRQWTERICQEFYEQGDEEKIRHMTLSPYMDRNEPAVAKLQDSFIAHIVNPLAVALNEAGLLPNLPGLPESELIINLKHNHQKWLQQIELEQQQPPTPTDNGAEANGKRKGENDVQQKQQSMATAVNNNNGDENANTTKFNHGSTAVTGSLKKMATVSNSSSADKRGGSAKSNSSSRRGSAMRKAAVENSSTSTTNNISTMATSGSAAAAPSLPANKSPRSSASPLSSTAISAGSKSG